MPISCCLFIPHMHRSGTVFFFFNDTATTEIYTLSLHDALPISTGRVPGAMAQRPRSASGPSSAVVRNRSEEHTSELQSRLHLVCRLLLEKKKKKPQPRTVDATTLL